MKKKELQKMEPILRVIIPVLNEEASLPLVLKAIPAYVREVIVIDNGSIDSTPFKAREGGATLLNQPQRGYGAACQKGLQYLHTHPEPTDIVVFLDGDFSDFPEEMEELTQPIIEKKADLVIGNRNGGKSQKGSLLPQARFGNALSCFLMKLFFNGNFHDLGPFRAIGWETLKQLKMADNAFGWTVEMQCKALILQKKCLEIPVSYRVRKGVSKISGTLKGTILAGATILSSLFYFRYFYPPGKKWGRRINKLPNPPLQNC